MILPEDLSTRSHGVAGLIIAANHPRAFTDLGAKLHGGLEQILKDPQLLGRAD